MSYSRFIQQNKDFQDRESSLFSGLQELVLVKLRNKYQTSTLMQKKLIKKAREYVPQKLSKRERADKNETKRTHSEHGSLKIHEKTQQKRVGGWNNFYVGYLVLTAKKI